MSSSSSDENETTIHASSSHRTHYSQSRAGSSKRSGSVRHDVSDAEDDEEHYARFREETVIEVDDAITVLLSSLHFEQRRSVVPNDKDDNELRELHEKMFRIITNEPDSHRRRRLKKALPASSCVREQVYYLRRKPTTPPASYYHRLNAALHTIVKESFGEEYRKVATVLGLVEALAEVLILEVHVFGIPEQNSGEHRNIRKLIANALTNLTYGQIHSKRRLCSYDGFIRCVVRIIIESPNITQVYAGLIRNLSWNADSGMSEALQPTVHALAIAAVHATNNRYDVTATLSALWNLAGHSVENKRTICETPNCLAVLANLLSPDARFASLVDSATGILKYVSQYLANTSTHLELRSLLITRMLTLLKSASFTCVTNTLGAIANLIVKDPHMQLMIRQDAAAVQQLNVLRNSNRDDIRSAVKSVLNTLNQPSGRFGEMSMSMGQQQPHQQLLSVDPQMQTSSHAFHHGTASPRLLSLRATRASPGKYIQPQMTMDQHRSCSLPRHFAAQRNGCFPTNGSNGGIMAQSYNPQMDQQMMYPMHPQQMFQTEDQQQQQQQMMYMHQQNQYQQQMQQPPQPPIDEDLDIPTTTVMGTRSNSERSLGSMNPGSVMTTGGWNSTLDTAANSSRALSPVSFTDIPASPTMCAQVFNLPNYEDQQHHQQQQQHQHQTSNSAHQNNMTHYSNGSANTMTRSSEGAPTVPIDNLITPTYAILNPIRKSEEAESPDDVLPGPAFEEDEGDYAIIGQKPDEELLTRSIQSEMPKTKVVSPRLNGFFSPRNQQDAADRLLMESIRSEMPTSSSGPSSKNETADRRDASTASHEPSDRGVPEKGSFLSRMQSLESQASSEDSVMHTMRVEDDDEEQGQIDASLPMDCVDDEDYDYTDDHFDDYEDEEEDPDATQFDDGINPHLTIDCSIISSGSGGSSKGSWALATSTPIGSTSSIQGVRQAKRVSTNGKTRLPVPKTNGSLIDKTRPPVISSRPRLPPKPSILKERQFVEEDESIENQTRDDTIYVNAPIVEAEQERIYMNALKQNAKEDAPVSSPTTKSAVVSPFNYQKSPFMTRSNASEMSNEKSIQPNSKQMLVTIV